MNQRSAIVVLHGLWMPGGETWPLRNWLAKSGSNAYVFRYQTVSRSLDDNAEALRRFVDALDEGSIHFIGFSLGGVVAAWMLKRQAVERAGRLVCLGSPLNGSRSAAAMADLPGGRRLLGLAMLELNQNGGLGEWREPVELGVIAGDVGIGLGRVLGVLNGPNDGTVAVEETQLRGAKDHIVRHVSHTSMLFSARVWRDALTFIKTGFFRASGR